MLSAEDWRELIPDMGPRNRLKRAVKEAAEQSQSESLAAAAAAAEDAGDLSDGGSGRAVWDLSFNELFLPRFFPDMEDGVIQGWYHRVGEQVKAGTSLCKVDTELAVISFDAPEDGYLAAVMIPEGAVKTGGLLGVLVQKPEDIPRAQKAHGLTPSRAQRHSEAGLLPEARARLEAEDQQRKKLEAEAAKVVQSVTETADELQEKQQLKAQEVQAEAEQPPQKAAKSEQ